MKKIKVLHFTIGNKRGGRTEYALRIWNHIDKERFQCDFATMCNKLDFAEKLESQGCKIHYISAYSEVDPFKFAEEINRILDEGYDVLHLHTSWWRGFDVENIAKARNVPKVIVHAHNSGVSDVSMITDMTRERAEKLHYFWQKEVTENIATDFLACSPEASEWLFADRISKDKIKIVPYTIDIKDYLFNSRTRNEYREKLGIEESNYVIGHVGRFTCQKNHAFLIDVFKKISAKLPYAILLLIGKGELELEIRNRVVHYNLEDKVRFLGVRDDVACLMQVMDLFAFPSRFEGCPIALTEAQAADLQCVVSETITPMSKITDKVDFLPLESQKWVDKILKYSKGYERKNTEDIMKNAGYNMDAVIKQIEEIYEGD